MSEVSLHPLNRLTTLTNRDDQALVVVESGQGSTADATETRTALGLGDSATQDAADLPVSTATQARLLPGLPTLRGNMSKLDAKTENDPDYRARVLYIGDSLVDLMVYSLTNRIQGDDGKANLWNGTIVSTGTVDRQWSRWPNGRVSNLSASRTSLTFSESTVTPLWASQVRLGYIAENGAGTFKVEVGPSTSGPWTEVAASVDADNGGTAVGVVVSYTLPVEGLTAVKITRLAGDTTFVACGFETDDLPGGQMFMAKGGFDLDEFTQCPEAIVAPVIAAFDPDVIYFDAADSEALITAHLEDYIARLQSGLSTPAGVVVVPRNPWRDDTDDASQKGQAALLYSLAKANGWGFHDWLNDFGTGTLADSAGLVQAAGNVHPSDAGNSLKIETLANEWPGVWGAKKQPELLSDLRFAAQPITSRTLQQASMFFNNARPVSLGSATLSTSGSASATRVNGMLKVGINASTSTAASGKAILANYVTSGVGTGQGTRFYHDIFFRVQFVGRSFDSAVHRVFVGANANTLTSKGFGIELAADGCYLMAHDGTTLTKELITASWDGSALYNQDLVDLIVRSDSSGNVRLYKLNSKNGTSNLPTVALVHTITGGPTTAGASGDRYLMAVAEGTLVSNVNEPAIFINAAWTGLNL